MAGKTKGAGAKLKNTADQVIEAIQGAGKWANEDGTPNTSGGIAETVARRLNVHRNTVMRYRQRWASVDQAFEEETEVIGDIAESNILTDIRSGNVETSKWYASKKLMRRGYRDRQEVTGADGGPVQTEVVHIYLPDNGRD